MKFSSKLISWGKWGDEIVERKNTLSGNEANNVRAQRVREREKLQNWLYMKMDLVLRDGK